MELHIETTNFPTALFEVWLYTDDSVVLLNMFNNRENAERYIDRVSGALDIKAKLT